MNIKNYDKFLSIEEGSSGKKVVYRQSPFKHRKYEIFQIKNRFIGGGRWIVKKLFEIDTQKHDIIPLYIKKHQRAPMKKQTSMHKDLANFIIKNEQILV